MRSTYTLHRTITALRLARFGESLHLLAQGLLLGALCAAIIIAAVCLN